MATWRGQSVRILEIGAADPRFRTITFGAGDRLNLLIAEKTRPAGVGDTRNGTGKTEVANIARYLLGGKKPARMAKSDALKKFEFYGVFSMAGVKGDLEKVTVRRALNSTKIAVEGWSRAPTAELTGKEWSALLARYVFRLPEDLARPTVGQLFGQFLRSSFAPTKTHPAEADWETGCRYAFLFGIDASIAAGAGEYARLTQQQKALSQAAKNGALANLKLDVSRLRGRLVSAQRERDEAGALLREFRVEERYSEHQERANAISFEIARLNERDLILQRSLDDLDRAMAEETRASGTDQLLRSAEAVYSEIGIAFSDVALRRFEDVQKFHSSVVHNRRMFLENQRAEAAQELTGVRLSRGELDSERASLLRLLDDAVALSTYHESQRSLAILDAEIAGIEDRMEIAQNLENLNVLRDEKAVESRRKMHLEVKEQEPRLDEARRLFSKLTAEIYGNESGSTRSASLDLGVSPKSGAFLVHPKIASDGSSGISSVETWVMDMVTTCMAIKNGLAPGFLFHDSALFDAVDSEQVASCLNIGARLAETHGFQYIVSMNSDALEAALVESGNAFDAKPYLLETRLSDASEDLRLLGFLYG